MMDKIDSSKILMGILASLCGYIFYGYIGLSSKVESMATKMHQMESEQKDLWGKYNAELENRHHDIKDFYIFQLKDAEDKSDILEKVYNLKSEIKN